MTLLNFSNPKTLVFVASLLLLTGSAVLGQSPVRKAEARNNAFFGLVKDNQYSNDFFGFSFPVPHGFTVIETEKATLLNDAGIDMLKNENAETSNALEDSLAKQETLIAISEKPVGSERNSALEIAVAKQPERTTAKMVLAASVIMMTSTGKLKLAEYLKHPVFGGHTFAGAVVSGEFNGVKIDQELYVIIRRGYSVLFAVTYSTDNGRKSLIGILEKMQFTKL